MQRINEFKFYELSKALYPLFQLKDDAKYTNVFYDLWTARKVLSELLAERPLHVCVHAANKVISAIDSVVPRSWSDAIAQMSAVATGQQKEQTLPSYASYRIKSSAEEFETVLSAETLSLDTYLVSKKGGYHTPDLIEQAEVLLPESIRKHLPERAVSDIRQAGRCLALDTPTGAGFHILRALEAVIAMYYSAVLGKLPPTRMRNWGVYIKKLEDSGRADSKITEFLRHIKDNYRNPITHPEVMLTDDEVEVLLGVALSAMRQMMLEIQRLNKAAILSALPAMPTA